jgi:hypothetical protein
MFELLCRFTEVGTRHWLSFDNHPIKWIDILFYVTLRLSREAAKVLAIGVFG